MIKPLLTNFNISVLLNSDCKSIVEIFLLWISVYIYHIDDMILSYAMSYNIVYTVFQYPCWKYVSFNLWESMILSVFIPTWLKNNIFEKTHNNKI